MIHRLDDFKLDTVGSKSLDVTIGESVLTADLELTMEGASTLTLTLDDSDRALLRSDTLSRWVWGDRPGDEDGWLRRGRAVDAKLGDLDLRLVKVGKQGDTLTLVFEDRIAAYLRRHNGARKVSRAKFTRAEFVKMLVDEVKADGGIKLHSPELHKRQPIAKRSERMSDSERSDDGHKGLDPDAKLTVKGHRASREQRRNMERVLDVADSHEAGPKATLALVEACIVESEFHNLSGGDADSEGILQLRVSLHGRDLARDVERSAAAFLTQGFTGQGGSISLARHHADWSAGRVAQACQGSAFPDRYDKVRDEASAIMSAYQGGGGRFDLDGTYVKRYEFSRGKHETSWDAIGRLAEEVNWRRFVRMGRLWFVSEHDLFQQKPQLRVKEGEKGVDWIDFDVDEGARDQIAEVTVQARSDQWTALPGMVTTVEGCGPADGRWLVSSVQRSIVDPSGACNVTLRKPLPELAEPRSERVSRDEGDSGGDGSASAAYTAAKRISDQDRPYVYGGGHGKKLSQIDAHEGLDCSSSTSLALKRAGLFDGDQAIVSGEFASSWGKPGKGKELTVWANAEHVWIEFNISGKRGKRFDTSPHGSGGPGPRLRFTDRSTAGFTPRHWPGT